MSESNNDDQCAPSKGPGGQPAGPPKEILAQVESPGIAPETPGETLKAEAAVPPPPSDKSEPARRPAAPPELSHADAASVSGRSTALVLSLPRLKVDPPAPEPEPRLADAPPRSSSPFRLRSLAAMVAVAALVGGVAGSLATTGTTYFTAAKPVSPVNYTKFADALGRVDHELAALKTGVDSAAKATNQQVAKINDRMDRAEKAQAEAGTKLAKATDVLDRVERKLASTPATSADVTGAIDETHVAAATPPAADTKRLPSALVVDGWVLRDVYNGAAMIQSSRGGIIAVLPGDALPGLGRIEQVKRQDGRWVVVTSRGLIVPR
jgi:hypothetical protein